MTRKPSASSALCCLPPELLARIALFAVAIDHSRPPRAVVALLLTCRRTYNALNFYGNKALWAQVFRLIFDVAAPTRRLGARATVSFNIATELKKRFESLHRIKRLEIHGPHLLVDLWTAFLLMLEDDGRNVVQLLDWAELPKYLNALISFNGSATTLWSRDPTQLSLLVWLIWLTSTAGVISNESPEETIATSMFLHSLIESAHDFSSFHGPDDRFKISLPHFSDSQGNSQTPRVFATFSHTFTPDQRYIIHYGHPMTVAVPPVTPAAFLAFTARRQCISNPSSVILRDDVEFTAPTHLRLPTRNNEDIAADSNPAISTSTSECYDPDWSRLTCCINPIGLGQQHWQMGASNPAAPGRWTGIWVGQFLAPYRGLRSNPQGTLRAENPQDLAMASSTLCCRLREYHCLSGESPVASGEDVGESEQITNCWLPRGTDPQENKDKHTLDIYDPTTRRSSRYYSPVPGEDGAYRGFGEKDAYVNRDVESPTSVKYDTNSEVGNGNNGDGRRLGAIRDIVVTGSIEQRQGDNWLDWAVIGRVRLWDGLLVLRRKPPPNQEHLGSGIFRGYLTAGQIVGRWRNGWLSGEAPQLEGPFVISKVKD